MTGRRAGVPLVLGVLLAATPAFAQVPDWPSERPPRPLAAREVKFPPYAFKTLSNGLQVIAVAHHEQPAVTLRLIVRAGAAQDPAAKPGTAALAASLLDQGTTSRTAEQIANSIDSIGGVLGTGAGSDLTFVNAAVMRDSLDVGMQLLAEVVRNPAFSPQEVERQRQQIMSAMKVSYEDPDYIAGTVFDRLVYGFHPYGKPDAGTPASITSLTREDLVAFHARWFGANNAILAIVGDVPHDRAFAAAEKAFGNWAKVDLPATTAGQVPPATRRVIVVDRPGAVQTEIRVGHIGLPRRHKDFLALDLALKILGGEGGNRLHRVLRTERGLTYGAEADMHALKDTGDIVVNTDTRSESTAEALRLIVDEMWRLQKQRVQQRELADAQAYLTGSFPLTIETPGAIALQVLNAVFYGLDLEELQNLSRTRQRHHPRRHPAGGAAVSAPGSSVDRARRRRIDFREGPGGGRFRSDRTDPVGGAGSGCAGPASQDRRAPAAVDAGIMADPRTHGPDGPAADRPRHQCKRAAWRSSAASRQSKPRR